MAIFRLSEKEAYLMFPDFTFEKPQLAPNKSLQQTRPCTFGLASHAKPARLPSLRSAAAELKRWASNENYSRHLVT